MMDKYLKVILLTLNKKYDITLIEITKFNDGKIGKCINFNYKLKEDSEYIKKRFYNKTELVRWLQCLE